MLKLSKYIQTTKINIDINNYKRLKMSYQQLVVRSWVQELLKDLVNSKNSKTRLSLKKLSHKHKHSHNGGI